MTNTDTTVHAVKAPLQSPTLQAAQLIEVAQRHGQTAADVRAQVAEDVVHGDPRLWAVNGYDQPITGTAYHAAVLAVIDRVIGDEELPELDGTGMPLTNPAAMEHAVCAHDGRPIARRLDRVNAHWHHDDDRGGRVCGGGKTEAEPLVIDVPTNGVTGKQWREQVEHIERLAGALANGQVRGPMHAAVARLVEAVELLRIWTPDDRSI
jgi:hypothetical protein